MVLVLRNESCSLGVRPRQSVTSNGYDAGDSGRPRKLGIAGQQQYNPPDEYEYGHGSGGRSSAKSSVGSMKREPISGAAIEERKRSRMQLEQGEYVVHGVSDK